MQKKLLSYEMISLSEPRRLDKKNARLNMVKEFDYLLSDRKTPFYVIEYRLKGERNVHVSFNSWRG